MLLLAILTGAIGIGTVTQSTQGQPGACPAVIAANRQQLVSSNILGQNVYPAITAIQKAVTQKTAAAAAFEEAYAMTVSPRAILLNLCVRFSL